jgi:hypothetical protein
MKKVLPIILIFFSLGISAQESPKVLKDKVQDFMQENNMDLNKLEETFEFVKEMVRDFSKNNKVSIKTKKKYEKMGVPVKKSKIILEKLEAFSKKISEITNSEKKDENRTENLNRPERFNNQRGGSFSKGNRLNPQMRGGNFSRGNRVNPQQNSQMRNPVFERLIVFLREQGVSRENMRTVMDSIRGISEEYRNSKDKQSYIPNSNFIKKLSDSGLNEESINAVVEIIKALSLNRR